jgi:hypothetical protein
MWMRKERTMTASPAWTAFHHRGEVLRAVIDEADLRRDGILPTHLSGVTEAFHDEVDLVGVLQLRWHTRLAGRIEHHLAHQPEDLEAAVRGAWAATAEELPGIRAILDRHTESPSTPEMERALTRAVAKERVFLATMAGRASQADERAEAVGREIEQAARASYQPAEPMPAGSAAFVARLKAALAA